MPDEPPLLPPPVDTVEVLPDPPLLTQLKWAGGFMALAQTWFLIQGYAFETRAYTPGKFGLAHPIPHDTTPTWTGGLLLSKSGPPESP